MARPPEARKSAQGLARSSDRYVLELVDHAPAFRREEIDLLIENAIIDVYGPADEDRGDDIVCCYVNKYSPNDASPVNPRLILKK